MRIQNIEPVNTEIYKQGGGETESVDTQLKFRRTLTDLTTDQFQARMQKAAEEIAKQGQRVAKSADLAQMRKYREMIRDYMEDVVSNGYAFDKFAKHDTHGRRKVYALIQKVNGHLEEMAKEILQNQSGNLDLMSHVDDIRGLLLDMLL